MEYAGTSGGHLRFSFTSVLFLHRTSGNGERLYIGVGIDPIGVGASAYRCAMDRRRACARLATANDRSDYHIGAMGLWAKASGFIYR